MLAYPPIVAHCVFTVAPVHPCQPSRNQLLLKQAPARDTNECDLATIAWPLARGHDFHALAKHQLRGKFAGIAFWLNNHMGMDVDKKSPLVAAIKDRVDVLYEACRTTVMSNDELEAIAADEIAKAK